MGGGYRTWERSLGIAMAACLAVSWLVAGFASGRPTCDRFAAISGSNAGRHDDGAPFRTAQALVDSLRPGQTGCLQPGTYYGEVRFNRGGARRRPITLRSVPGSTATVIGRVYVPAGSNYVRVVGLRLDGRNADNLPSPTVDSAWDQFVADDVTNDHTAVCFELGGNAGYGAAIGTVIEGSRIHDCGRLPPTNHEHGIYVANSVGARIIDNLIYDNADRGIQLYWNAQRTRIAGNIIDHNGEGVIISGDFGFVSSHNLILNNIITNSTVRADVESYWPEQSREGVGNLVAGNCLFGGRRRLDSREGGFVARDNLQVNPRYTDAAAAGYGLAPGSPCAALLARARFARAASYPAR